MSEHLQFCHPRPSCCHPRRRSGIQGLGGVVIWKDAGRHPSAPLRAGSFVSAKEPKTSGARAGPPEKPKVVILNAVKNLFFVGSRSLIESSFATLPSASLPSATLPSASLPSATLRTSRTGRTSAALRQSSPLKWKGRDRGTAPPGGARTTAKENDAGSSHAQG